MSAHRYQATWRSLTFNPWYDNSGLVDQPAHVSLAAGKLAGLSLDSLDITKVSVQDYRELRQFLEGGEPNEAYEGVRALNGEGRIFGTSPGDLEDRAWTLSEQMSVASCRLAAMTATPPGVLPFSFRRDTGATNKQLRFYARPGPGRPVWIGRRGEGLVRPYRFQLIAFDPFAYDETVTNTNLGNLAGGANTIANPGNLYSRPVIVITFSGAGNAALILTNSTTGKAFSMDLSGYAAAQVLTLDSRAGTMTRDDGSNQYSKRLAGYLSDLYLLPGNNTVTWSSATGITSVQFQVRGAYA